MLTLYSALERSDMTTRKNFPERVTQRRREALERIVLQHHNNPLTSPTSVSDLNSDQVLWMLRSYSQKLAAIRRKFEVKAQRLKQPGIASESEWQEYRALETNIWAACNVAEKDMLQALFKEVRNRSVLDMVDR